jgi:ABC-type multidrug transport system ATPase subunit
MRILGIYDCGDTLVGDGMVRGVSGGQKRRVTLGEIMMTPRPVVFMDAISNGLDAATTFDIVQAIGYGTKVFGKTTVISLLQVCYLVLNSIAVPLSF